MNREEINRNSPTQLSNGDTIQFGTSPKDSSVVVEGVKVVIFIKEVPQNEQHIATLQKTTIETEQSLLPIHESAFSVLLTNVNVLCADLNQCIRLPRNQLSGKAMVNNGNCYHS